jgi:hypothetical protein
MVKPDRRSFQASSAVDSTMMAAGAMVWPRPTSTPHSAVTSMAAEVVSSVPWWLRTDCTFKMTSNTAVSHSTEMAYGVPSAPPSVPIMLMKPKVRRPASLPRRSRSSPISKPSDKPSTQRTMICR